MTAPSVTARACWLVTMPKPKLALGRGSHELQNSYEKKLQETLERSSSNHKFVKIRAAKPERQKEGVGMSCCDPFTHKGLVSPRGKAATVRKAYFPVGNCADAP